MSAANSAIAGKHSATLVGVGSLEGPFIGFIPDARSTFVVVFAESYKVTVANYGESATSWGSGSHSLGLIGCLEISVSQKIGFITDTQRRGSNESG
ncbi:hypothetical protein [Pseudomonas aeruginosa]|uniref:hypothetical protein n=1 Tax=Pseudomonas aeruginosa TaxID=287 RepID=UPI001C4FB3F5|nr:hypothetical protein [Pseudomonas aeruginosa]HDU2624974.1 hypothetical protein [Pseudomonas aeruginosa]HDU2625832.1 hypothetical protein [Pseudomonas aeruginosa]